MENYLQKLNDLEKRTEALIKELGIKFNAKRLFSFATLYLLDFEDSKSFKIVASENFKDLNSKVVIDTAMGEATKYKKKTTKHQIFLLGNRKLQKLSKEDAIEYLAKGIELIGLYKQYRATREAFQAEFESKFAINISANNLYVVEKNVEDREKSEYIKYRRALENDAEYKEWSSTLFELETEDENLEELKNIELSNK